MGSFYNALRPSDILYLIESHGTLVRPVPQHLGYFFLVCRQEIPSFGGVWGSGGVACYFEIFSRLD
jgi:hypothetical protein